MRNLAAGVARPVNATEALASGREGRQQRAITEPGHAAEARRRRRRVSVADVIFKALCLVIAAFFVLILGGFGVFLYLLG